MKHYHFPQFMIDYISNLYKKINGRIVTKNWESNIFYFKKGLFQGDALSGPIFLTVFNPIIEELKKYVKTMDMKLKLAPGLKEYPQRHLLMIMI